MFRPCVFALRFSRLKNKTKSLWLSKTDKPPKNKNMFLYPTHFRSSSFNNLQPTPHSKTSSNHATKKK